MIEGSAAFDRSRRYRYELTRRWHRGRTVCWIMLNPSTADEEADDPTIRRCLGFAQGWSFGAMVVVNLFALRSTDPAALKRAADPVGPRNDQAILKAADRADLIVAAWGRHGSLLGRDAHVRRMLHDHEIWSIGHNLDGSPTHPLFVRADAAVERYEEAAA